MIYNFKNGFPSSWKNCNKLFYFNRKTFFGAVADAQKSTPDKKISGKFLGPGQRYAQNISAKNLYSHDQRHGDQKNNKNEFFQVRIQPVKYFFHGRPPFFIFRTSANCFVINNFRNSVIWCYIEKHRYSYFK